MASPRSLDPSPSLAPSGTITDVTVCELAVNTPLLLLMVTAALFFWRRNGPVVRARGTVRFILFMSVGLTSLQSVALRTLICTLGPIYHVMGMKIACSLSLWCIMTGGFLLARNVFLRFHKLTMAGLLHAASSGALMVDNKTSDRTRAIARLLAREAALRAYFFVYMLVAIAVAVLTSLPERDRLCGGSDCHTTPGYWPFVLMSVVINAIPMAPMALCVVGLRLEYRLHAVDTLGIRRLMHVLLLEMLVICVMMLVMCALVFADEVNASAPMLAVAVSCFIVQVTVVAPEILQDYRYRNLNNSSVELPDFINGCTDALRVFLSSSAEHYGAFKGHVEAEFCVEGVLFYRDVADFVAAMRAHELEQAREQPKSSSLRLTGSAGSDSEAVSARERVLRDMRQRIIDTYLLASSPLEINVQSKLTHGYRITAGAHANRAKGSTAGALRVAAASATAAAVHPEAHPAAAAYHATEEALLAPLFAHEFEALENEVLGLYTANGTLQRFLAEPRHKLLWDALAATKAKEKRVAEELASLRSQA
jgi:hypothetical protein